MKMKKIFITGGAGFIGSNARTIFIKRNGKYISLTIYREKEHLLMLNG